MCRDIYLIKRFEIIKMQLTAFLIEIVRFRSPHVLNVFCIYESKLNSL